jgi:hypothetical protein
MIEYEYLCQAIEDCKAGRRPSAPLPPSTMPHESLDVMDSGIVMMEEGGTQPPTPHGFQQRYGGEPVGTWGTTPNESLEELDLEQDEDWERDYGLEETDDAASFDLYSDLQGYFVAEQRIERAWQDPAQRRALFAKYGIRDEPHLYQVRATVERYINSADGQGRWGDRASIMEIKASATMGRDAPSRADLGGGLELDEGEAPVPLESYVEIMVAQNVLVEQGFDADEILAEFGMSSVEWASINAWWSAHLNRRMMENDEALMERFNALQQEFDAKYSAEG